MTDLRADMKKAVEFGVARFAPIWQRDWEKIMAESRRMTDRELMQQVLDLLNDINQCSLPPTGIPIPAEIDYVMEALRTRLAQPEPEADVCCQDFENCRNSCTPLGQWIARIYCGCGDQIMPNDGAECGNCVAARNAVKNKWKWLTEEEIDKIANSASSKLSAVFLAESQLRGKNAL